MLSVTKFKGDRFRMSVIVLSASCGELDEDIWRKLEITPEEVHPLGSHCDTRGE